MGGKKGILGLPESSNERLKPFIFHFFLSLSLETSGRILNKKKKKKTSKERRGENCPLTEKAISVGVRLAAPRFLAGLIAFHYKFPPQPIRDRSAAVRPADTRALIGALFSDTRLMTERRAGRSACSHTYSSCTHFLHVHTLTDFTQIYHEKTSIFFIISYPTCAKLSSSDVGGCFLHPRANKPSRMISGEFILYPLDCVGARWNTKQTAEDVFLLHEMLNFTLNMWISAYNNKKKKPLSP